MRGIRQEVRRPEEEGQVQVLWYVCACHYGGQTTLFISYSIDAGAAPSERMSIFLMIKFIAQCSSFLLSCTVDRNDEMISVESFIQQKCHIVDSDDSDSFRLAVDGGGWQVTFESDAAYRFNQFPSLRYLYHPLILRHCTFFCPPPLIAGVALRGVRPPVPIRATALG